MSSPPDAPAAQPHAALPAPPHRPRVARALELTMAAALLAMVVMVFGNVVLRYAFNDGITVSEELSRWLFVWLTFLGALLGLMERAHLGTDLLTSRVGPRAQRALQWVALLLMLGASLLLLWGAWAQTRINWDVEAPVTGASMAWLYASGVVFGIGSSLLLSVQLWKAWHNRHSTEAAAALVRDAEDAVPQAPDPASPLQPSADGTACPAAPAPKPPRP